MEESIGRRIVKIPNKWQAQGLSAGKEGRVKNQENCARLDAGAAKGGQLRRT